MQPSPPVGQPHTMQPGLRRIIAPNPSPMTYWGTNTYLLGEHELAVIDPGPDNRQHLEAILNAVAPDQQISHIIVTHSHLDHSPLARPLSERCGAPVLSFGDAQAGRSKVMRQLANDGMNDGGEGIDLGFRPDHCLTDGEVISGNGWQLEVIHTPGHLGNHIALGWGMACFTADHVMGWASSLVSPPDGDLTDFMASCEKLRASDWEIFHPGHGAPVLDPAARLDWLISHRKGREAQILAALHDGPATALTLAQSIYTDTPPALIPAAMRNVFAHLVDLTGRQLVAADGNIGPEALFELL
ncbi:MAG: MBL fold metallo-hydrolase [Rhodobacteraceae bacterium]|nr:MBL fold metallo-hydrolase [Paracoccaceae bacterium]